MISVPIVDITGKKSGTQTLPNEIFGVEVAPQLLSQAVRVYLDRQHQGTRKVKGRGDVSLTTAKVWRQKGTGRARHGSKRAPIFVGGGKAHGPKGDGTTLRMNRKMKRKALMGALTIKVKDKALTLVKGLEDIKPKTKEAIKALENTVGYVVGEKILVVISKNEPNVTLANRNIEDVVITGAGRLNIFEVLGSDKLILTKEGLEKLENTFIHKKEGAVLKKEKVEKNK
jgi:large subunit ribosomal protein L4